MGLAAVLLKPRGWIPDKYRNKKLVYFVILLAVTLDNLNVSGAMNTEASIAQRFNADISTVSWVLSGYALTLGAFIILFGKLADIIGVHTVFVGGCFWMAIFSLLTAVVTQNIIAVIIFRALQGMAGAALLPSGYGLTANYFHGEALELAIKGFTIALCGSFGAGTILGGAFSSSSSGYQGFFYFTFAVAAFCSIFLYFFIIPIEETEGHKNLKLKNLNVVSVFLLVVGLLLVIFGFTEAGESWNSPKVYVTIPIGFVIVLSMFLFENIYIKRFKNKYYTKDIVTTVYNDETGSKASVNEVKEEKMIEQPTEQKKDWRVSVDLLFPFETFKITNFGVLLAGLFCCNFSFIALLVNLIQYHIYLEENSSILAAVKVFPLACGIFIGSALYRTKIMEKYFGPRIAIVLSGIGCCGFSTWISRIDFRDVNSYWKFEFAGLLLYGYFANIFFMVYMHTVISNTPLHLQGVVSGIYQTAGQVAIAIASAIVSTIIGSAVNTNASYQQKLEDLQKYRHGLYSCVAASALLVVVSLFVKNPKSSRQVKQPQGQYDNETSSQV